MASLIKVKLPLIKAWDAIIVAQVEIKTLGNKNQVGIISKNGFLPFNKVSPWCISQAACPKYETTKLIFT